MVKYLVGSFSYAATFLRVHLVFSFYWLYGDKRIIQDLVRSISNIEIDQVTKARFIKSSDLLLESFDPKEMQNLFDFFSNILDVDNKFEISDIMLKMLTLGDGNLSVRIIANLLDNELYKAAEKAIIYYIGNNQSLAALHNVFVAHINQSITNPTNEIGSILYRISAGINDSNLLHLVQILFELGCYEDVVNVLKNIKEQNVLNDAIDLFFNVLRESHSYYHRVKAAEVIIQSGVDINFDLISVLSEFNLIHKIKGDAFLNVKTADEFSHLLYIITNEIFAGVFFDSFILKSWGSSILEIQARFGNDYAFEVAKFLIIAKEYDGVDSNIISKIANKYHIDALIESVKWQSYLRCYEFGIGCDKFPNDDMLEAANMLARFGCASHIHAGVLVEMLNVVNAYDQIYNIISCTSDEDAFVSIIKVLKGDAYSFENPTVGLILYSYNICGSKCMMPALNAVVTEWDESFYSNPRAHFIYGVKSFIDNVLFEFYKQKLMLEIESGIKELGVMNYMKSLIQDLCLEFSEASNIDNLYKVFILREENFIAKSVCKLSNIDQFLGVFNSYDGLYMNCPEYGCDLQEIAFRNIKDLALSIQDENLNLDYYCMECLDSYVVGLFSMQIEFEQNLDFMIYERVYACCSDDFGN